MIETILKTVGEFSTEVNIEIGHLNKTPSPDGIV